ncbi:Kch1p [Saccharomyces paradoxus]|uniref:Kch1p n=1 Tax=Saccharomyces paradoxus TaxID=27291 RepID=A0A8B8UUC7_SACPA|nr:Kch1 [Saccharomyces paradoxus]QHS74284.1 Kch1 [Saccharomyces paradoxus]
MFNHDWKYSINSKTFADLNIELFRNHKFKTVLNYLIGVVGWNGLKVALFVSDVYTCIKLLAFNSWSNNIIKPYLSFKISKWLFSGCILASIVLLIWEAIAGMRIYRTGNISLTYVNNFSRNLNSVLNYSKFCVYNMIERKGFRQKMTFFTFFQLKDCIRLIFTDTPRQVINGLTLWSVLVTVNKNEDLGDLESFTGLINKIKNIGQTNHEEAVILSLMLFSFIIWALFVFKFLLAIVCSIFVYYKIINDQQYSGLREYICVTVSENVDELVERQRKKENDNTIYKTGLLESQTFDDFKEVENTVESSFNDTSYTSNNDSTIELIERRPECISQDACGPISTMKKTETMESFVDNSNPQYATRFSAILDSPYINSYNGNNIEKTKTQKRSVVDTPKYEDLSSSGNFNQIPFTTRLLKSTTSTEFRQPLDSIPNTSNNLQKLNSNSSRPRPPRLQTSGLMNLNAASNDNERIYTPMKAYFREADLPRKGLLEDEDRAFFYT